jgi:hypothetical protein
MSKNTIVSIVAGALAGLGSALCANALISHGRAGAPPAAATDEVAPRAVPADWSRATAAAVAMRAAAEAEGKSPPPPPGATPPPPPTENPRVAFRARLEQDAQEPLNQAWADRTEQALRPDFDKLSKTAGLSNAELVCRSKTCTGFVEWPSQQDSVRNFGAVLHNEYSVNSGIRMLEPETPVEGQPYRVSLILEPMDQAELEVHGGA